MARKPNPAFMKEWNLSDELAAVCGTNKASRPQVVKKLWEYIKKNGLQDKNDKKQINADDKMQAVFGKSSFSMFEMNKLIGAHLS